MNYKQLEPGMKVLYRTKDGKLSVFTLWRKRTNENADFYGGWDATLDVGEEKGIIIEGDFLEGRAQLLIEPANRATIINLSKDEKLVEDVRWWLGQDNGKTKCPITRSGDLAELEQCGTLCYALWPDLMLVRLDGGHGCPCYNRKPVSEVFQKIVDIHDAPAETEAKRKERARNDGHRI